MGSLTKLLTFNVKVSNSDAMSQLLRCDGINDTDAFGLGPYFDGYGVLPNPDSDLDLLLDSYATEVNTSITRVKDHKALLEGTHFKLVSYETGPAGTGDGSATDLAIQAHRNVRMKQILGSLACRVKDLENGNQNARLLLWSLEMI